MVRHVDCLGSNDMARYEGGFGSNADTKREDTRITMIQGGEDYIKRTNNDRICKDYQTKKF